MTEDLSSGCNLILGKNGSGKSNFLQGILSFSFLFFLAIIFALSDSFRQKNKQEKRKFLHVNSLFVFIDFFRKTKNKQEILNEIIIYLLLK